MSNKTERVSYKVKARHSARDLGNGTIDMFKSVGKFCMFFFVFLKDGFQYLVLEGLPNLQKEINKNIEVSEKSKGKMSWKNPYSDGDMFKTSLSDFEIESPYDDFKIGGGKKK